MITSIQIIQYSAAKVSGAVRATKIKINILTLSRPLDVNYVLEQGQGHGHLSKYLVSRIQGYLLVKIAL